MIIALLGFLATPLHADEANDWIKIYTSHFKKVEGFFLGLDCDLLYNSAFLYSSQRKKLLTKSEVAELLPEYADEFVDHNCRGSIASDDLASALNYSGGLKQDEPIMLYFDLPGEKDGQSIITIMPDDLIAAYKARLAKLTALDTYKKYKIKTAVAQSLPR